MVASQYEKCRSCKGNWYHWSTFQKCRFASTRSFFAGDWHFNKSNQACTRIVFFITSCNSILMYINCFTSCFLAGNQEFSFKMRSELANFLSNFPERKSPSYVESCMFLWSQSFSITILPPIDLNRKPWGGLLIWNAACSSIESERKKKLVGFTNISHPRIKKL